jgi:hypothetical protein
VRFKEGCDVYMNCGEGLQEKIYVNFGKDLQKNVYIMSREIKRGM